MNQQPPQRTPPEVVAAIFTVAVHLEKTGYGCAIISPQCGVIFQRRSVVDEKRELLDHYLMFVKELARQRRRITKLRKFIRWSSAFVGWSKPDGFDEKLDAVMKKEKEKR